MTTTPAADLTTLRKRVRKLLLNYGNAEAEARTPITREIAESLVEARSHFQEADGNTDWRGKTYPYRTWLHEIFQDAHISKDDLNRVQSSIRYHVSAVLRSRLDQDELERLGMISQTARERSSERRQARSALLATLSGRDANGGALMALTALSAILSGLDDDEVVRLQGSDRDYARAKAGEIERRAKALLKSLA